MENIEFSCISRYKYLSKCKASANDHFSRNFWAPNVLRSANLRIATSRKKHLAENFLRDILILYIHAFIIRQILSCANSFLPNINSHFLKSRLFSDNWVQQLVKISFVKEQSQIWCTIVSVWVQKSQISDSTIFQSFFLLLVAIILWQILNCKDRSLVSFVTILGYLYNTLSAALWYEASVLRFWYFTQWMNIYCRCATSRFQFDRPKIVEITGVWT